MAHTARFSSAGLRASLSWEAVKTLLTMIGHAFLFWRMRRPPKLVLGANPDFDRLRACFAYLEHLVRVGAFLQGFVEKCAPGRLTRAIMNPYWRLLIRWSERSGYAFGIGNAKKFRLRMATSKERDGDARSAYSIYELISSPTGLAIDYRDRAEAIRAAMASLPAGAKRDKLLSEARDHFEKAQEWAQAAGNASLELKIMDGRRALDPGYTPARAEVEGLLGQIQGPAYERAEEEILTALTE
jgi:hypothetical protein